MYDVIIIGAGPSGTAAARLAGQRGLTTLLIETEQFPRVKPCAGAVSEQAMSYLDFDIPEDIIEKDIFGARVHFGDQVIEKHKNQRLAILVTRSIFDNYLLRKAQETGIETAMPERVLDFRVTCDHVDVMTVRTSYRSKFLVIAEGAHGILKHKIRRKDQRHEYAICVVAEIEEDGGKIDEYIHNAIDIHFGMINRGYGWIFPHNSYFSIGIGGLAKDMSEPKKMMTSFLSTNGFTGEYDLKVHLIPSGGIKRKVTCSRVILCGDAAGFVDCFSGEGIAYAIRSGQIAIDCVFSNVSSHLTKPTLRRYRKKCEIEFGRDLKYSLLLTRLMHKFPSIFFGVFTANEEVLDRYLDISAGRIKYKEYLKWLVLRLPKYLLFCLMVVYILLS